jgi:hypothetical protein
MGANEENSCPRCGNPFICKPGDIANCLCYAITLNGEERAFIGERYTGCLCYACLKELKNGYVFFREKYFFYGR